MKRSEKRKIKSTMEFRAVKKKRKRNEREKS